MVTYLYRGTLSPGKSGLEQWHWWKMRVAYDPCCLHGVSTIEPFQVALFIILAKQSPEHFFIQFDDHYGLHIRI